MIERYRFMHIARKVVGVGSVGTRCWVILMLGRDQTDPLILQLKEAMPSVLEPYTAPSAYESQGRRVVEGQRLMQTSPDYLLGWYQLTAWDGLEHDFYVRQLWDGKASIDVSRLSPVGLRSYGEACGWTLARGHARTGTGSRWRPISVRVTPSIERSPSSPTGTPTRTPTTTPAWSVRSPRVVSPPRLRPTPRSAAAGADRGSLPRHAAGDDSSTARPRQRP